MRLAPPRMSLLLTSATFELVNVKELTPYKRRKHSTAAARSFFSVATPKWSAQNQGHSTGSRYIPARSICAPQKC
jgi:hypothetical protein